MRPLKIFLFSSMNIQNDSGNKKLKNFMMTLYYSSSFKIEYPL